MLRLRFSVGVLFGLLAGVPMGAFIALLAFPRAAIDAGGTTSLQVQDLTRKLDAATIDRARVDQQLEQLQKLAEQMTTSFNQLELRFRALSEERARDAKVRPPAPPPPAGQLGRQPAPADFDPPARMRGEVDNDDSDDNDADDAP